MSGGAHEKPCTHIPISELFAKKKKKKSRTQTPVKKSNLFLMPQISFPCPGFGPFTLPNTIKVNYYFCLSASCLPAHQFRLSNYLCMYSTEVLLYGRLGTNSALSHCAIVGPLANNTASLDPGMSLQEYESDNPRGPNRLPNESR